MSVTNNWFDILISYLVYKIKLYELNTEYINKLNKNFTINEIFKDCDYHICVYDADEKETW